MLKFTQKFFLEIIESLFFIFSLKKVFKNHQKMLKFTQKYLNHFFLFFH